MTESDYVQKYIQCLDIDKNTFSVLNIAINDARLITGRNQSNGKREFKILSTEHSFLSPYSFIGIINYLLILDLIGTAFKIKNFTTTKSNNIYKCLKQLSSLNDKEINVIIALRNSLAHNYSLVNIPHDVKQKDRYHHFSLINDYSDNLVSNDNQWEGNYSVKNTKNETQIGIENLYDEVEKVILNLKHRAKENSVSLNMELEEFKMKFTIKN